MRTLVKHALARAFRCWTPYTRLLFLSDSDNWVIANEKREISQIMRTQGCRIVSQGLLPVVSRQCLFYGSHFDLLLKGNLPETDNRIATAYFHGKPGTGIKEFDICYENLKKNHSRISRIQVSCSGMRDVVCESGIDPGKVHLIPIGINLDFFSFQSAEKKASMRNKLGIPQDVQVIGSFQKDGVGWGEGMEPKLVKGPDVFLEAVEILHQTVPDLYVLLSGPARGYVKAGLQRIGVPFKHVFLESYQDVGRMYHALDLYLVTSREEGGPKAVLESMASGVPLVSTRVGQGADLVEHGVNGWLTETEDQEALAYWSRYLIENRRSLDGVLRAAEKTALENTYTAQIPLWREFLDGFVGITLPGLIKKIRGNS